MYYHLHNHLEIQYTLGIVHIMTMIVLPAKLAVTELMINKCWENVKLSGLYERGLEPQEIKKSIITGRRFLKLPF